MTQQLSLSRRRFLQATGLTATGLVIGASLPGLSNAQASAEGSLEPNVFIVITEQGETRFICPNVEMGQGAQFGLTTLIAEEMDIEPAMIKVEFAPADTSYAMPGNGVQITGGSASIRERFIPLREASAATREVLLLAASKQLGVPKDQLSLKNGQILAQGKATSIGEFVATAQTIDVPDNIVLNDPSQFKWIGKDRTPRTDALAKATGTATFGLDVDVPNAKVAAVKTIPVFGATVKSFDDTATKKQPGVLAVMEVHKGVAVVAETYWQAKKALETLTVEWTLPELARISSPDITRMLEDGLKEEGSDAHSDGDIQEAFASANKTVEARYYVPYLSHTPMEPMNCTVKAEADKMDIWIGTQGPGLAAQIASEFCDISRDNITVHTTYLGGGFGRRGGHDYVAQAVQLSVATGHPIKLIWSRENDQQNDYYRPVSMGDLKASLDQEGRITGWSVKRAGPNIMPYFLDEGLGLLLPEALPQGLVDWVSKRPYGLMSSMITDRTSVEGFYEDYSFPNYEVRHVTVDPGLRVGPWRSVGHTFTGFFVESFMDELAHEAGQDPLAFRLKHMDDNPRLAHVLKLAADKAGWGKAKPGHYQGLACHTSFQSYCAQVVEVSIEDGDMKLHRVTCAIDCGIAVNPDIVKSQMESGIIYGLTAALYGEVTLDKGEVQETNFDTYEMVRMDVSPKIDVHIVSSTEAPTGVGEPGTPPIAPALANAWFAASGTRLREMPFKFS